MKTDEFRKQLHKLGVDVQLIKGRQKLLVNNQIIGFVGEMNVMYIKMNGNFNRLVDKNNRDAVTAVIAKYALTPLEERNEYLLKNYIVPLFESDNITYFLSHGTNTGFSIQPIHCHLKGTAPSGISQVPKAVGEYLSDITFTGIELNDVVTEANQNLASLVDKQKKYILPEYVSHS